MSENFICFQSDMVLIFMRVSNSFKKSRKIPYFQGILLFISMHFETLLCAFDDQARICRIISEQMSHLMRLWYLSHKRPGKAQASLPIRAVSPEPSLFAYIKYESERRVRPNIRHLAPLEGCACAFEEWVYGGRIVP